MSIVNVKELWQDFVFLLYPNVCVHCNEVLVKNENVLCTNCTVDLPQTFHADYPQNSVFQSLAFLQKLNFAGALLQFNKRGVARSLLHKLKYSNRYEVGVYMGQMIAREWREKLEKDIDFIIPVPIHRRKEKSRGYNQSQAIAEGIQLETGLEIRNDIMIRVLYKSSQTRKGKTDRWTALKKAYKAVRPHDLKHKRILLLDDVITTGATISYLAEEVLKYDPDSLSILAFATGK
jgi:ComF family protein